MTNAINMPNYKDIYHILMRDSELNFKANVQFNFNTDDHKAIVKWASGEYPAEYKEALAIASDPNREVVTLWKDDLEHHAQQFQKVEWERDGLSTLIYDFVMTHDLQDKFYSFLNKAMKEDHDGMYGDLEFIARDYQPEK